MTSNRFKVALGGAAAAAEAGPLVAAQAANQMQNCPAVGKWSIAVWDGDSGTAPADALATCGENAVAAAYSLDAQTQAWSRWFADKPEVSNLAPLNDKQGVLALGAGGGAPPPPAGPEAELAAQLYAATDTDAAAVPMLQVYDYLGAGLYTVDGQPIQAGAETGPDDFRLYDFESGIMLQAYIERQRFPVDRLATFLGQAGVLDLDTGQPFTGSEWLAVLSEAVSRGRADDSAFTVRLIDALSLVRSTPLDLTAAGLDPATTYLDGVQVFLILYDVLFGLPAETGAASVDSAASADNAAELDTVESAGIIRRAGQIAIRVGVKIGRSTLPAQIERIINDALLAYGFIITLEPESPQLPPQMYHHWFPCKGSHEVTLKAKVVWDVGKFNEAVRQANLMGFQWLPVPGVQDDIRVSWTATGALIPKNGSWKETANSQMTDENGETSIIFVPKTERRPGEGTVSQEDGTYEARLKLRSWYNPLVVWDLIGLGPETNYAFGRLFVEHHKNWTVEVEGGWEFSYEGIAFGVKIPTTSIPLEKADGDLVGTGTTNWVQHYHSQVGDAFCTLVSYPPQTELHVQAIQQGETLSFNVSAQEGGTYAQECCVGSYCEQDAWEGPTTTVLVKDCSVPAEDGASVSCPWPQAEGVTASFTLTLREE